MADFSELIKMVETGKVKVVKELVNQAIADGIEPKVILDEGLLPGMSNIGEKFKNNEVYVPEVLIAARAMNAGVT
ncbi:MAG: B12-binding domain-containing protein, partial [Clostridia bacterium]|nr:B12-binding domain-containing protein [Clostridia bacterium]